MNKTWLTSLLGVSLAVANAAPARDNGAWKLDTLKLKSGRVLQGLIEREDEGSVYFRCVVQNPGSPTAVFHTIIPRTDIRENGIEPLAPEDREKLRGRVDALDRALEKQKIDKLVLTTAAVEGLPGKPLCFTSPHFLLVSDAREEIIRRAAFRLQQIYAAYISYLPPRHKAHRPTRIVLYRSLAEYQGALKRMGRDIVNPALYDPERNEILCASDLERVGQELERNKLEHQRILDRLRDEERELRKKHKGRIPAEIADRIAADRKRIEAAENANQKLFEKLTQRLFQTLYHEAFHAYLANFVYPPDEAQVPRWLNEGLAQIFETAILEAAELRVGHADPARLRAAQELLKSDRLVPIAELIRSKPEQFIVGHTRQDGISDRFYLSSWAVAFYLTFHLHKLHTIDMDEYASALKKGEDPEAAFKRFVKQPLEQFEKEFHVYLAHLRPSGNTFGLKESMLQTHELDSSQKKTP
jgi:hypothetical protein